jgi:chromatin segregation and condensation protein Rec8/ScpA/Scc1 (kleisin family)
VGLIYLILGPICERLLRFSDEEEDEEDEEPGPPHTPCPRCPGYVKPDETEREPPRKQVGLRRKVFQRKQRVQQGDNWYDCSTTPPTRKLPKLSHQEVRDLMQRKIRRLDEARRRQQHEHDSALIVYVDRSKYIGDFNTTARFMVTNSWFIGIWVSMR